MPDSVQEFFETLPARADTSKTAGMNNSYGFDIEGAGSGRSRSPMEPSPCTTASRTRPTAPISASQEIFGKIIAGEQNPTSAYMTGKLKLKGDMGAAMKLQKLFPDA